MPDFVALGVALGAEPTYVAQVWEETWGHLRAEEGVYAGTILFAASEYESGERVVIRTRFPDEVPDGPWFFDEMYDLITDLEGVAEGRVYLWTGTYTHDGDSGTFEGSFTELLPEGELTVADVAPKGTRVAGHALALEKSNRWRRSTDV